MLLLIISVISVQAFGAWQLQDGGRIKSRWATDVNPYVCVPYPEYPRPQLVRLEWRSLNGLWQHTTASSFSNPPIGQDLTEEILVPYPVESALSGIMDEDFSSTHQYMWYRRMEGGLPARVCFVLA